MSQLMDNLACGVTGGEKITSSLNTPYIFDPGYHYNWFLSSQVVMWPHHHPIVVLMPCFVSAFKPCYGTLFLGPFPNNRGIHNRPKKQPNLGSCFAQVGQTVWGVV